MKHRKISYFLIFLAATLFNPVPEVLTQLVLAAAAMIALFEIFYLASSGGKHAKRKLLPNNRACARTRILCYNTRTFGGD